MLSEMESLLKELELIKQEHTEIENRISYLQGKNDIDQIELQRLKKRKLKLKDRLAYIESKLYPDIIA